MPSTTANPTALGTTKSSVSDKSPGSPIDEIEAFRQRRMDRYRMRPYLGRCLGPTTNIAKCGWRARPDGQGGQAPIEVRRSDTGAFVAGVLNCSSPWLCPVCTPKLMTRRGQIIDEIAETTEAKGGTSLFVTFTARHFAWDDADVLVSLMTGAFGAMLKGREWAGDSNNEIARKTERDRTSTGVRGRGRPLAPIRMGVARELGYVGLVRVVEISQGCNGLHPHVHAALVFDRALTDTEVLTFTYWLQRRWTAYLKTETGRAADPDRACDVRRWTTDADQEQRLGWYVTKVAHGWSMGSELAGADNKQAKGMSKNVAQLAAEYVQGRGSDKRLGRLLQQIHGATLGKKAYYCSPKLAAWCGLQDKTDEELASEDQDGQAVAEIVPAVWTQIRRQHATADALDGAEHDGLDGLVEALHNLGIPVVAQRQADDRPPQIRFADEWSLARHHSRRKRGEPRCKIPSRKAQGE